MPKVLDEQSFQIWKHEQNLPAILLDLGYNLLSASNVQVTNDDFATRIMTESTTRPRPEEICSPEFREAECGFFTNTIRSACERV